MDRPQLRDVEIIRVKADLFALRDPLRYTEEILIIPAPVLDVLALLDGKHSLPEVRSGFAGRHGAALPEEILGNIIETLDSNGFLEGESFEKRRRGIQSGFAAAAVRAPAHAGGGYEPDADGLKTQLAGYFASIRAEGSGLSEDASLSLRAVIAPHIDIRRGNACYARSYAAVKRRSRARTVVLLGIAHNGTRNRYAFTRKDFATPLGVLRTDAESVDTLASACSFDPFEDESAHRCEHSLEFQAVFLQHAFPDPAAIRIVPVLCGAFLPDFYTGGSPAEDRQVSSFISGLRALAGPDVLVIAGADLCHIGRRFGDTGPFTQAFVSGAKEADLKMLESVTAMDAEGFMCFIQRERDRRRVCGAPAIYALVSALCGPDDRGRGRFSARVLSHEMAVDAEGESAVGFAAVEICARTCAPRPADPVR
jgi:AmmeMemoRadiSam system protein B